MPRRTLPTPATYAMDMTPMIDVIFLLLIFWMTVARLSAETPAADLETPVAEEGQAADIPRDTLTVDIRGTDDLRVAGRRLTRDQLAETIGRGPLPRQVVVRADAGIDAAEVQQLFSALRQCGVSAVGLAVREVREAPEAAESPEARR